MQNGNRSIMLLQKLAERLGPEALSKLAAETLTGADIVELQKLALTPQEQEALMRSGGQHTSRARGGSAPAAIGAGSEAGAGGVRAVQNAADAASMPQGPMTAAAANLAPPATPVPKGAPGSVWAALGEGDIGAAGRATAGQADTVWNALKKAPGQAFGEGGPGVMQAIKNLGGAAHANPAGAAAIGLPTAALAYLAYKALADRGQRQQHAGSMGEDPGYGDESEMKLSAMGLSPQLRAGLDKLAADPGIKAACFILEQYGLMPH